MLKRLRPLPRSMQGVACALCDRMQSCWQLTVPFKDEQTVCSLCVLYHPQVWTKEIQQAITNVETGAGHMFERDVNARLTRCSDADRVLGVVVLTDRILGVRERSAKLHGGSK
jgi:hypothetical protein